MAILFTFMIKYITIWASTQFSIPGFTDSSLFDLIKFRLSKFLVD